MALDNLFKLEKLKIEAYSNVERSNPVGKPFEAMFNPESFSRKFEIVYGNNQGLNTSDKSANFTRNAPVDLNLKLILDGTGVTELVMLPLPLGLGNTKKVSERVEDFLKLAFYMNSSTHEPNYLKVSWGDLSFPCRLGSVNINYTNFDRSGHALRAELDLQLISDEDVKKRLAKENKNSPDLTHSRIVMAGDTLPLLTKQIYGSSVHYLLVAQFNRLDDFRNLTPGQRLYFPPLPQEASVH
jgi:hypothetical protein